MSPKALPKRPPIEEISTADDLRQWYWLKEELMARAKALGLRTSGGKFTILDRIAHYLETGETAFPGDKRTKASSKFDWHVEDLSAETVITDSYKNTKNVRRFFKAHAGDGFKFNIEFMAWMKANTGKTLGDAVGEYNAMRAREASDGFQTKIAPHNQFNQYTRDFLADNPTLGMDDVRRVWALKRALPSATGRHEYEPADLLLDME